jgi:hypothetical protein
MALFKFSDTYIDIVLKLLKIIQKFFFFVTLRPLFFLIILYNCSFMKRKFYLFFLLVTTISCAAVAQAPLAATNPNFVHDKLTDLMVKSQSTVSLPDSVTQILINYARNKSIPYQLVLRNSYMFKVLYNENLSIDDRLFGCKYYILANSGVEQHAPLYFLQELQTSLNARK